MISLVFATGNPHKLQEIQDLSPPWINLSKPADWNFFGELPETGSTLEENAVQKATELYRVLQKDCFAEDTGLEVYALDMQPGVDTAHFAGPSRDASENMNLLLNRLEGHSDRRARFRTVIALILGGAIHTFEGIVEGRIAMMPSGRGGFGYDPVFIPEAYVKTFADLPDEVKASISHRSRAFHAMVRWLELKGRNQ